MKTDRNSSLALGRRCALAIAGLTVALAAGTAACGTSGTEGDRQAQVAERGRSVMPFDLERTTHRFTKTADGGVETVVADDPQDQTQIRLIREHLTKELAKFRRGDFGDPSSIHGGEMPGLKGLSQGYAQIQMRYETTPTGARIIFATKDASMISALHAWFDAQVADHGKHAEHG
jgi:hypothetical protein